MSSQDTSEKHLVILGAGVCGLYAALTALRQGLRVTVIENKSQVGGLAAGHQRGENYYDMGVHMLHAFDKGVFEDVSAIMGDQRIEVPLDSRIRWQKNTYQYPLKFGDLIKEMPFITLSRGVIGLLYAEVKRAIVSKEVKNAEEALISFYGKPLYSFFFESFTHKYWGIHPRELSAEFIRRKMPRLSAVDFVRKSLLGFSPKKGGLTTESCIENETLHYSQKGAHVMVESLAEEVVRLGGVIELGAEIKSLCPDRLELDFMNTNQELKSLKSDFMLSTIPLNSLVSLCPHVPDFVAKAAKAIYYKPISVYGLLVNKPKAMDGLYTYFRDRAFHRVGEPKNAGLKVTPSSSTILIVEMTCEVNDEKWGASEGFKRRVMDDLEAEGICCEADILEWHTFTEAFGYPVYKHGYEAHLKVLQDWIKLPQSFISTGRQGGFTYPTMHKAMRMGADAVDTLIRSK